MQRLVSGAVARESRGEDPLVALRMTYRRDGEDFRWVEGAIKLPRLPSAGEGRGEGVVGRKADRSRHQAPLGLQSAPVLSAIRRRSALFIARSRLSIRIESARRRIGNATVATSITASPMIAVIITAVRGS